jgi:hypothetical protein
MSAVTNTPASIAPVNTLFEKRTLIAGADITAGQPIQWDTNGKWILAKSDTAPHSANVYIALHSVKAGQALEGLRNGDVYGFDLSGLAYQASVFLADDGSYATTAGTVSVAIGVVAPTSDGSKTKVLFVKGN